MSEPGGRGEGGGGGGAGGTNNTLVGRTHVFWPCLFEFHFKAVVKLRLF